MDTADEIQHLQREYAKSIDDLIKEETKTLRLLKDHSQQGRLKLTTQFRKEDAARYAMQTARMNFQDALLKQLYGIQTSYKVT